MSVISPFRPLRRGISVSGVVSLRFRFDGRRNLTGITALIFTFDG